MAIAAPLAQIGGVVRPFVFGFGTLGVLVVAAQIGVIAGSLAKSLDQVYSMESIIDAAARYSSAASSIP